MTPLRLLLLIALVALAAPKPAEACSPGQRCTPYKPPPLKRPYFGKPSTYVRATGTKFRSFTRSKVISFLTGATWDATLPGGTAYAASLKAPPKLRFVDAEKKLKAQKKDERYVLVRRIEYRETDKVTLIEVDDDRYALEPCPNVEKRMCLSLRNDLHFEAVDRAKAKWDPDGLLDIY